MNRAITMPDGEEIELSERQATWIGLEPAAHPDCDGCVLFGCCVRHSYPAPTEVEP